MNFYELSMLSEYHYHRQFPSAPGNANSGDHSHVNDAGDAFRHAYAMGELAQEIGFGTPAQLMGIGYEFIDFMAWCINIERAGSGYLPSMMDIHNNREGIEAGLKVKEALEHDEIYKELPTDELKKAYREEKLAEEIARRLTEGELITDPLDPRTSASLLDQDLFDKLKELEDQHGVMDGDWLKDLFDLAQKHLPRRDPLALDLDGDGLETTGFSAQSPIWFDHDINGSAEGTGWLNSDDGFLVLDRNGNGTIDDGSELFGDHTPLYDGSGNAANGFAALGQEDSNADGLVNNQDANWNDLRVWRDLNQDGISQSNELFTLSDIGITGIHIASEGASNDQGNGNQVSATGSFIWEDGHEGIVGTGQAGDIDFSVDTFHSTFTDTIELIDGVEELPDRVGSGLVYTSFCLQTAGDTKTSRRQCLQARQGEVDTVADGLGAE